LHALNNIYVPIAVALIVLAIAAGPVIYREFMFFAALTLTGGLLNPQVALTNQWSVMENFGTASRYYMFFTLGWLIALIMLSFNGVKIIRIFSKSLIVLMLVLFPFNFFYPKFTDTDFYAKAAEFKHTPAGTEVTIIEKNPPGWDFTLIKK
jgi:hypothetical protein